MLTCGQSSGLSKVVSVRYSFCRTTVSYTHLDVYKRQNMRILELLRFLYERTDENHPATVSDIIAHLNGKGIQAVRQTVYADTNALIDAGIDIVVVKSTQNQ